MCRRRDLVLVRGAVEKMAEAARKPVPGKPGGFVALLLTSIGLALAAPLIATLLLRFGVPSRPCPDPACEQQDAATLTVVFQLTTWSGPAPPGSSSLDPAPPARLHTATRLASLAG